MTGVMARGSSNIVAVILLLGGLAGIGFGIVIFVQSTKIHRSSAAGNLDMVKQMEAVAQEKKETDPVEAARAAQIATNQRAFAAENFAKADGARVRGGLLMAAGVLLVGAAMVLFAKARRQRPNGAQALI
jgi:hypothetical protein